MNKRSPDTSARGLADTISSYLDRFVPSGISDTKEVRAWRYMIAMVWVAIFTHIPFALQYVSIGFFPGAYVVIGSAFFLVGLPWLGLHTGNKQFVFLVAVIDMIALLTFLTIGQGTFVLTTTMWFAIMPAFALFMIDKRTMWITLALVSFAGVLCFSLTQLGIQLEGFTLSRNAQAQTDFIAWVLFVIMAVSTARIFPHTLDRGACVRLLQTVIPARISLMSDLPEDGLENVAISGRHIVQTVLNIAINARDAMPDSGELYIELKNVTIGPQKAQELDLYTGNWIRLRIRDTGTGMDKETLARMFAPFYTTKSGGTGLGLSVVFGLVQKSGGTIGGYPSHC